MSRSSDSLNPWSESTTIKGPLTKWLILLCTAAVCGGLWFGLRADVTRNTQNIEANRITSEFAIRELQSEQRQQRELLIRIDENVKQLKERR